METKNEIGSALKKKLQGAQKSPSPDMWGKINDSLDKKDRRRKRALWLWGAGLLLIGIVSFYIATNENETQKGVVNTSEIDNNQNNRQTITTASEIDNTQEITSGTKLKQENLEGEISEKIKNKTSGATETKKGDGLEISVKESTLSISEENIKKSTPKIRKPKEKIIDEGYEVTKSYRYYNSKTKEEIITENKIMMDSVIEKNIQLQKSLDSITELKSEMEKDSI